MTMSPRREVEHELHELRVVQPPGRIVYAQQVHSSSATAKKLQYIKRYLLRRYKPKEHVYFQIQLR
ncbi:hypothetical protein, partial [Klebsiella pneumoniae]|uniref:hypothetical protein n=1 Tax=Klebsiella pneumoniae TaxID=573 RepID=UPI0024DEB4A4